MYSRAVLELEPRRQAALFCVLAQCCIAGPACAPMRRCQPVSLQFAACSRPASPHPILNEHLPRWACRSKGCHPLILWRRSPQTLIATSPGPTAPFASDSHGPRPHILFQDSSVALRAPGLGRPLRCSRLGPGQAPRPNPVCPGTKGPVGSGWRPAIPPAATPPCPLSLTNLRR